MPQPKAKSSAAAERERIASTARALADALLAGECPTPLIHRLLALRLEELGK